MPLWLAAALLVLSLSGIFLAETASISLRHPLRPAGSSLRRLYRTDPSVCGCGTEPAAGIVKRDLRP